MSEHERWLEECAPYVLGALTEPEHDAFAAHLAMCAECRAEVASLQAVASTLAAAVPQWQAPAVLKSRVMSTVESEAALRDEHAPVPPARRGRARRALPTPALGWLAAALVLVALVLVLALAGSGGGTRVISAQVTIPRASASLHLSSGHAELTIADMPQSAPGRVYEVWLKRAGGPLPTDVLFTVSSRGAATVAVPGPLAGLRAVMVTSEPEGGTLVPTTQPLIVASLS
jgi:anti-sigma-K factor RskA